jgi:hypothetical protein
VVETTKGDIQVDRIRVDNPLREIGGPLLTICLLALIVTLLMVGLAACSDDEIKPASTSPTTVKVLDPDLRDMPYRGEVLHCLQISQGGHEGDSHMCDFVRFYDEHPELLSSDATRSRGPAHITDVEPRNKVGGEFFSFYVLDMPCLAWTDKKGSGEYSYAYSGFTCDWSEFRGFGLS